MAHIASQLSTQAIFTSDNPRTENPDTILEEMEEGSICRKFKKNNNHIRSKTSH
jgi:UDP-N-acetylmuramoyl-L-alanyl-D-glutamate--2,6-diaminopimelate ligase